MIIGIPKEIMQGEKRVSAIPDTVRKMVQDGLKVLVEKGAGAASHYFDEDYLAAGAEIVANPEGIYKQADVILKVKEPQFNHTKNRHEIEMMHTGQYLITFLHPAAPANHDMVKELAKKGVIGLTLDSIPRISRAQAMDALSSMSTCAGYKGILMAANNISRFMPMIGSAVGMIKPANVLVIGAGVAGLRAIATAKGLGAIVHAVDIRPEACEQAKSLGAKVIELGIPEEVVLSSDRKHAKDLPISWLEKEREILKEYVQKADIILASALIPGKVAPIIITEEMVKSMQPGSCIVDISIDQGGNCELTVPGEKTEKYGVIIEGIKNIPGTIPNASTWMFANNIYNLLKYLIKDGEIQLDLNDEITSSILVTKDGEIIHAGTKEAMGLL
ncbi:MAG: NAD(P) transhydrogenase subunit alpha [Bacilli bacterium]